MINSAVCPESQSENAKLKAATPKNKLSLRGLCCKCRSNRCKARGAAGSNQSNFLAGKAGKGSAKRRSLETCRTAGQHSGWHRRVTSEVHQPPPVDFYQFLQFLTCRSHIDMNRCADDLISTWMSNHVVFRCTFISNADRLKDAVSRELTAEVTVPRETCNKAFHAEAAVRLSMAIRCCGGPRGVVQGLAQALSESTCAFDKAVENI